MDAVWSRCRGILQIYVLSVTVWVALAFLTGWQDHNVAWAEHRDLPMELAVMLPMLRYLVFAMLTPPLFYVVRRYPISLNRPVGRTIGYIAGAGPFVAVYICSRLMLFPPYSLMEHQFVERSVAHPMMLIRGGIAEQIGVYFAVLFAAHAYVYFTQARDQELERSRLQQALATSELAALKAQLHPHFLFNTLHNISTLIDTDGGSAKAMLVNLSSLLRLALQHGSADLVTLKEETKFIAAYLDLEKMRLGPRLTVEWSIDPATLDVLVPQMILQPLVENAILHGIACCRDGGWIRITAQTVADALEVNIVNSVGGKQLPGLGLGLKNTTARLEHLYAADAKFSFSSAETGTATATLILPALGAPLKQREPAKLAYENQEAAHAHFDS